MSVSGPYFLICKAFPANLSTDAVTVYYTPSDFVGHPIFELGSMLDKNIESNHHRSDIVNKHTSED